MVQARHTLNKLAPYVGPQSQETGSNSTFLASNESSWGPAPSSLTAVVNAVANNQSVELNRYPAIDGFALRQKLATRWDLPLGQIILGNGSSELLSMVARAYLDESGHAIYSEHCFAMYPIVVAASGCQVSEVPAKEYAHDLDAIAKAVNPQTKVIFIADPNNPTGTYCQADEWKQFLSSIPNHILVVWDRAYSEFTPEKLNLDREKSLLAEHANLLITHTFSKIYALAGLRIGYATASVETIDFLNRVRMPFNANYLAQLAAQAALDEDAYIERVADDNATERQLLMEQLQGLTNGVEQILPSQANFLTIKTTLQSGDLVEQLQTMGVTVRGLSNYGMPKWIRVTVGKPSENQAFLQALKQILQS